MSCAPFSILDGLGTSSIENDAHGFEKLLLRTQASEKFLHSEVNLIIQYIIVQDQDGQNNNIYNALHMVLKNIFTNVGGGFLTPKQEKIQYTNKCPEILSF